MIKPSNRASIRNISDYSPFGVQLTERTISDGYRFGFQGQEGDDEIKGEGNSVNYKFRMHDPRLGRFFAIDPLSSKYPHNSPYAFSENVVINAVELEGLERVYVFNSAYLSSQALAKIKTNSYNQIKEYLNGVVGTVFSSYENLQFAQKKLGENFNEGAGYHGEQGNLPASRGNLAVVGSYHSDGNNMNYVQMRLVIDNGNGVWSEKNVIVYNYKSRLTGITKSIEKIDAQIAKRLPEIELEQAEFSKNISDGDCDLIGSGGSFGGTEAFGRAVQVGLQVVDVAAPIVKPDYTGNDRVLKKLYAQRKEQVAAKQNLYKELKEVKEIATKTSSELIIK